MGIKQLRFEVARMIKTLHDMEDDISKFDRKGTLAAAVRIRKKLQYVRFKCADLRQEVQVMVEHVRQKRRDDHKAGLIKFPKPPTNRNRTTSRHKLSDR